MLSGFRRPDKDLAVSFLSDNGGVGMQSCFLILLGFGDRSLAKSFSIVCLSLSLVIVDPGFLLADLLTLIFFLGLD